MLQSSSGQKWISMNKPHHWRSMVGEDFSNQGLPVLHLGWSSPLRVSSGCAGPPSQTAPVLCYGPALLFPPSGFSHACSATADFSIIPLSQAFFVPSVSPPVSVWSPQCRPGHSCRGFTNFWTTKIWSYTVHVIWGQRLVRIAPPCLPPHHSGPATRDFQSSISVEALLWGCHLDVQGLLHQQLLCSAMVQHCGLLPVDWAVILPRMLCYSWLLHHPPLTGISVFLQSHLQSLSGLPDVDLATAAGNMIYHIGLFTKR